MVKPYARAIERLDGCIIIDDSISDDSISEKSYTDENAIICWHYDHSKDRMVKGINFLSAIYHLPQLDQLHPEVSLPVGFQLVAETEPYVDQKNQKTHRRSPISKNEHYEALLRQAHHNRVLFRFVLSDVWYSSADNMCLRPA